MESTTNPLEDIMDPKTMTPEELLVEIARISAQPVSSVGDEKAQYSAYHQRSRLLAPFVEEYAKRFAKR